MSDTPKESENEKLSIENVEGNEVSTNDGTKQVSQELEKKQEVSKNVKEVSESSRRHFKYRSNECLNCGQPLDLSDRYCPYCSQLNSTKQLSFGDFFREFFSSLISYDSRLWFTLKHLLFKPGTITKRYVEGHRLRYANPFRFFLSVSIIFFLLTGFLNFIFPDDNFDNRKDDSGVIQYNTTESEEEDEENLVYLRNREETFVSNPDWEQEVAGAFNDNTNIVTTKGNKEISKIFEEKKKVITEIDTTQSNTAKKNDTTDIEKTTLQFLSEEEIQKAEWGERVVKRFQTYNDFYENTDITNAGRALDSLNHPPTRFNLWLYEKNNAIKRIKEDPDQFISYLTGKIPFFLFFFAPFFALFFWLIYSKKKYSYMEHLVFIFHIFSFVFLGMLICTIPDMIFGNSGVIMGIFLLLVCPFYLYKALRNFYKQSRLITIIKFVFLNNVFGIAATIAAVFFFAVTAAIY